MHRSVLFQVDDILSGKNFSRVVLSLSKLAQLAEISPYWTGPVLKEVADDTVQSEEEFKRFDEAEQHQIRRNLQYFDKLASSDEILVQDKFRRLSVSSVSGGDSKHSTALPLPAETPKSSLPPAVTSRALTGRSSFGSVPFQPHDITTLQQEHKKQ